jgi:hypothetical protein
MESTQNPDGSWNIDANSIPTYQVWPWSAAWGCDDWITWFNAMLAANGVDSAIQTWQSAWQAGIDTTAGGTGTAPGAGVVLDSSPISCRDTNANFIAFLNQYPTLKATVYQGIVGTYVGQTLATATTVIGSAANIIQNTATTASSITDDIKKYWWIPVVVILAVILVVQLKKNGLIKIGV